MHDSHFDFHANFSLVCHVQLLAEGVQCMDDMHKKHKADIEYLNNIRKEVAEVSLFFPLHTSIHMLRR